MAWSPVRRFNAGRFEVDHPGDYATLISNQLRDSTQDINIIRYADFGVALYGHGIIVREQFAKEKPDVVRKVVKGFAAALKASIENPDLAIAAIKKREPLVIDKVESKRLRDVISNAIVTPHIQKNGLSSVDPNRMKQTIDTIASVFKLPAMTVAETYSDQYLPEHSELTLSR